MILLVTTRLLMYTFCHALNFVFILINAFIQLLYFFSITVLYVFSVWMWNSVDSYGWFSTISKLFLFLDKFVDLKWISWMDITHKTNKNPLIRQKKNRVETLKCTGREGVTHSSLGEVESKKKQWDMRPDENMEKANKNYEQRENEIK